ncbi:MAG: AAA family ATPase [bacterium]|nr:AAA family ATPase [bacterium]
MTASDEGSGTGHAWFLGAYWKGEEQPDQTDRFIQEGIWEHGHEDTYIEKTKSIRPGDRVAIKAWFTKKHGLPFDNHGIKVSVMAIKATGIVKGNPGDGRRLSVEWRPVDPPREWYFYTYTGTVWKIVAGEWHTDNLLRFTFDDEPQDIDRFRNTPFYRDRFGDSPPLAEPAGPERVAEDEDPADSGKARPEGERRSEPDDGTPYSVEDIICDGCFIDRGRLETMLERLRDKKNLILQGPPGTGKTWLAKRLAYVLIGTKSQARVRPFQFHPNLSYEDFVRGYRPVAGGDLQLTDGPFLRAVNDAARDEDRDYVLVIEEINRGNPAQIFGEMLTLLEADKRTPAEALPLSYPDPKDPEGRVHVPPNLYVIGTMNMADRSLALVDFALRRRFAFAYLEPTLGEAWRDWMREQFGLEDGFLDSVESRITSLNDTIAGDGVLGPQFQVGHSAVAPAPGSAIEDPYDWYRQIVETEIAPLLNEYWFETPARAREEKEKLLVGMNP